MSLKVAVPDGKQYDFFIGGHEKRKQTDEFKTKTNIYRLTEEESLKLLLNGKINACVLSPLAYAKGSLIADLRILPGSILAMKGYSGIANFEFKQGISKIRNCLSSVTNKFLNVSAEILLTERYEFKGNMELLTKESEQKNSNYDSVFEYSKLDSKPSIFDLSDLWYDSFEFMLPTALWVIPAEENPENIRELIFELKDSEVEDISEISEPVDSDFSLEGTIIRNWSQEFSIALEKTIDLMYYQKAIDEIADVKIFEM